MKTAPLTTLLLILSATLFGQEIKFSDLSSINKFEKEYESYVSKNGTTYKVGDRILIGKPSSTNQTFTYIIEADALTGAEQLAAGYSGRETEIKKIQVSGNKRIGYQVVLKSKGAWGPSTFVIQIETALETGEIKSSKMTSDEALAELKKAKEKLDLGLITQLKYDSLKTALSKYID